MLSLTRRVGESIDFDDGQFILSVRNLDPNIVTLEVLSQGSTGTVQRRMREADVYVFEKDTRISVTVSRIYTSYLDGKTIPIRVRLDISAPREIEIWRSEILAERAEQA